MKRHFLLMAGAAVALVALAATGVVGAPLSTLLVIGLLLLCPLMMLGRHGGGHVHGGQPAGARDDHEHAAVEPEQPRQRPREGVRGHGR